MYRLLDLEKTNHTLRTLSLRIQDRFPKSGLSKVCHELHIIAEESKTKARWISQPHITLRLLVFLVILLSIAGLLYSFSLMQIPIGNLTLAEWVQVAEAGLNNLVLIGAAILFLVTGETRVKRARALNALRELRAIAHVIDMHQLTKDPSHLLKHWIVTDSSPERQMSAFQLIRYLNYCSEMLSLTGKIAAIYSQHFNDSVVLQAVNDVENLTTGLSRKIWQKIIILNQLEATSKSQKKPASVQTPLIHPPTDS